MDIQGLRQEGESPLNQLTLRITLAGAIPWGRVGQQKRFLS